MNNDVEFLTTKLGKLDGFGETGEYLQKIIKSKQVKVVEPVIEKPADEKRDDEPKENEAVPAAESTAEKEEK
jgi:vacuolar protein sorting-associated protein 54